MARGGQTRPATEPVADQRKLEGPIHCKRVRSLRGKFRFKLVTVASNADRHPRWHCGRRKTPSPQERPKRAGGPRAKSCDRDRASLSLSDTLAATAAAGPQPRVAGAGKMEPRGYCHSELASGLLVVY